MIDNALLAAALEERPGYEPLGQPWTDERGDILQALWYAPLQRRCLLIVQPSGEATAYWEG